MIEKTAVTTLGGGCFWCLEAVYTDLEGVIDVISGYAGGNLPNPTYESVTIGNTGYAEVVQVTFDPQTISFKEILEVFFSIHDPTTPNRQGPDFGTHYRSAIFYHTDSQKIISNQIIAEFKAEGIWKNPIVTEVTPVDIFYPAEEYHQDYFKRNPYQGYCQMVINPKIAKFWKKYAGRLKHSVLI